MKMADLSGRRFGRLTVQAEAGRNAKKGVMWQCLCDCGNTTVVASTNLIQGHTQSCGCLHREQNITHGATDTKLYGVWINVKTRCNNPRNRAYPQYGGRGIRLCEEWESFQNFQNWAIKSGYADGLTLDRIDVNGNYSPENCRWADMKTQQNNRRNNHVIEFNGVRKTLSEWSEATGLSSSTLRTRLSILGWPIERALTEPLRERKR